METTKSIATEAQAENIKAFTIKELISELRKRGEYVVSYNAALIKMYSEEKEKELTDTQIEDILINIQNDGVNEEKINYYIEEIDSYCRVENTDEDGE